MLNQDVLDQLAEAMTATREATADLMRRVEKYNLTRDATLLELHKLLEALREHEANLQKIREQPDALLQNPVIR